MLKRFSIQITLLITLLLIASLFFTLDISKLINILRNMNFVLLSASFAVLGVEILLRGLRLKAILKAYSEVSLQTACFVTLVGFPFALVTPGRVGDLVKFHTLARKTPIAVSSGVAGGIFEKMLEFFSLFVVATLGIFAILLTAGGSPLLILLLGILAFGSAFAFLLIRKGNSLISLIFPMILKATPSRFRNTTQSILNKFQQNLSIVLQINSYGINQFIISLALWIVRLVHVFVFVLALGIPIKILYFFALMPLVFIAELLPISIMGLGVREYSFILLFKFANLPPESAVAVALLVFVFGFLPPAIMGYLLALKEYGGIPKLKL